LTNHKKYSICQFSNRICPVFFSHQAFIGAPMAPKALNIET
jgi:hypothetical protein